MATVTTAIQLETLPRDGIQQRDIRHHESSSDSSLDADPVLIASRIADNAVPDGGQTPGSSLPLALYSRSGSRLSTTAGG